MGQENNSFSEKNQSFWHLACIQTASLGFPWITLSPTLADMYGANAALVSILISGLVLWLIGFVIIAMAIEQRRNAIENAEAYIGKAGARITAFISMWGFPIWFVYQLHATNDSIFLVSYGEHHTHTVPMLVLGIVLGVSTALFALGRTIVLIKRLNTFLLPILVCYYIYAVINTNNGLIINRLEFSLPCTLTYISFLFAGIVNLPTFFRHARSKSDSFLGLTVLIVINIFFQVTSIWVGPSIVAGFPFPISESASIWWSFSIKAISIAFLLLLLLSSNLVNLYFSGPSWELMFPKIKKFPMYFVIGIISTFGYVLAWGFHEDYHILNEINNSMDDCIANLGVALVLIFVVRTVLIHRPKPLEKFIGFSSWLVGSFATVYFAYKDINLSLLIGLSTTTILFISFFYIMEPVLAFRDLKKLRESKF